MPGLLRCFSKMRRSIPRNKKAQSKLEPIGFTKELEDKLAYIFTRDTFEAILKKSDSKD